MRIAVPTETKDNEYRVALTAEGADALVRAGHDVVVQAGAGVGSAISDADYRAVGAQVFADAAEVWAHGDIICKVKEPTAGEYRFLRQDQLLFTYLHLAANRECTQALIDAGTASIAYETVQLPDGSLPLLVPMSEVAGRLAVQVGAYYLMRSAGGSGILMGGVPGARAAKVVIIGGGTSGRHAAQIASGMRADVTVIDLSANALTEIDQEFGGTVHTVTSSALAIEREVTSADLVIGAVLVPGARAPRLVSNDLVARMNPGSVLVDIAVDQGGCFEGTHPTSHADPTYNVHGSTFYAVANMPGAVPVTSTQALTNATLPYLVRLAEADLRSGLVDGVAAVLAVVPELAAGLTTFDGHLVNAQVAQAHGLEWTAVERWLPSTC